MSEGRFKAFRHRTLSGNQDLYWILGSDNSHIGAYFPYHVILHTAKRSVARQSNVESPL